MIVQLNDGVKILPNFDKSNPLPEFSPQIHSDDYQFFYDSSSDLFLRKIEIDGSLYHGLLQIIDGKVKDNVNDRIGLPCPPYCNNKGGDRADRADLTRLPGSDRFNAIINLVPGTRDTLSLPVGFKRGEVQELLNITETDSILIVNVLHRGTKKLGIIGLNRDGKILDGNDDSIVIQDN